MNEFCKCKTVESEQVYPYNFADGSYRCVGDRIIVRPVNPKVKDLAKDSDLQKMSEADLFNVVLTHPYQGEVVMVGDGYSSGIEGVSPPLCNVGDIVFLARNNSGVILMLDIGRGVEKLLVVREANCHVIQKKKELSGEVALVETENKV